MGAIGAAREAREAAAKAAGVAAPEEVAAPAATAPPPAAPKGPLEQLTAAEAIAEGIRDEASALTACVQLQPTLLSWQPSPIKEVH